MTWDWVWGRTGGSGGIDWDDALSQRHTHDGQADILDTKKTHQQANKKTWRVKSVSHVKINLRL